MFLKMAVSLGVLIFTVGAMGAPVVTTTGAKDIPGGLAKSAEAIQINTYELMLSPGVTLSPSGTYLSAEVRYQPAEEFGAGFGFGTGEVGFNFGLNGTWYLLPDSGDQPAVSLMGGLYMNRIEEANYFAVRVTPTMSKTFGTTWGRVTPYTGLHLTPNFRLGSQPDNSLSVKASLGSEFVIKNWNDMRLIGELGLGISNSVSEIMLGIAYPFVAL